MFFPKRHQPILLIAALFALGACDGTETSTVAPSAARFGKAPPTGSVSISSVAPDSGALSTTIDVKVNGSGFADGMVAVWQQSGLPDSTQIKTNSTRFVSSKQLIANITISGRATSGSWDVSVYTGGGKSGIGSELGVLKNAFKVTDPTATWKFPLIDAGLSVQSDHQNVNGATSDYVNGACNITTNIFAGDPSSSSGDATLNMGNPNGKCSRRFKLIYPDGVTEILPIFSNLRQIENLGYWIPIGATVHRQLHMGVIASNVASRCGGLVWGYGVAADVGAGSDSVLVTRVDASTWHVMSDPVRSLAFCKTTGQLFQMTVDFTVVSSRPLP